MNIAVGDWAVVESFHGCGLKFFVGEVLCVDDSVIVVKAGLQVTVERRDMIQLVGTQKQMLALKAKVDEMVEMRSIAMKAAEAKVHDIAGEKARVIRKWIKAKQKERA